MSDRIRVSLIDDQPVVLAGLRGLFASLVDFELTVHGRTEQDLVSAARERLANIILVDVSLSSHMIEAIATASQVEDGPKIVVFTGLRNTQLAIKSLEAGAKGYILKNCALDELSVALRQIMGGETYMTATFAMEVASSIREDRARRRRHVEFSHREEEVLRHLLRGHTNKEIASVLEISEKTVKQYMTIIIQKLNVRNRVEVVLAAQELFKSRTRSKTSLFS